MSTLTVSAQMENLEQVLHMINTEMAHIVCSEKELQYIEISAEEIFTNIASYAYESGKGEIGVSCGICDQGPEAELWIEFCDWGTPYNPLEKPDPDFDIPFEERRIGGLGIFMVKQFMDTVEYRQEDGCNILKIGKRIRRD